MLLNKLFFDVLGLSQFPTKKTKPEKLKDLINILKPVATNKNLIRFGSSTDGGYLIPDDPDDISACFSPGVADCVSFETRLCCKGNESFSS